MNAYEMSNVMNVSDVAPGLYILNVNAKGVNKSFKIEIKHYKQEEFPAFILS